MEEDKKMMQLSNRSPSQMSYPVERDGEPCLAIPKQLKGRMNRDSAWNIINRELNTGAMTFGDLIKSYAPTHIPFEAEPTNLAPISDHASFLRFRFLASAGEVLATSFYEYGYTKWVMSPDVPGLFQKDFFILPETMFHSFYEPVPAKVVERKVEDKQPAAEESVKFSIPKMVGKIAAESCAFAHVDTAQASIALAIRMLPADEELRRIHQKLTEIRDHLGQSVKSDAVSFGVKFDVIPA